MMISPGTGPAVVAEPRLDFPRLRRRRRDLAIELGREREPRGTYFAFEMRRSAGLTGGEHRQAGGQRPCAESRARPSASRAR